MALSAVGGYEISWQHRHTARILDIRSQLIADEANLKRDRSPQCAEMSVYADSGEDLASCVPRPNGQVPQG